MIHDGFTDLQTEGGDQMQQAYRFALDPTPRQQRAFLSHAGGARYAFNWGLAQISAALDAYRAEKAAGVAEPQTKIPDHFGLCTMWTAHKDSSPDLGWVGENSVGTYQAALRNAAAAWKNFIDSKTGRRKGPKVGRPRFKSKRRSKPAFQMHATLRMEGQARVKRRWQSLGRKGAWRTINAPGLVLPKIGRVTVLSDHDRRWIAGHRDNADAERNRRRARQLHQLIRSGLGRISRVNISREPDGLWYASVGCEILHPLALQLATGAESGRLPWDLSDLLDEYSAGEVEHALAFLRAQGEKITGKTLGKCLRERRKEHPELKALLPAAHRAPTRRQRENGTVGVDLGVQHLAVLSTGEQWDNPRHYQAGLGKLRAAQQALSRTQEGSRRSARARHQVASLHARTRRARAAATGRAATRLVRTYSHIVVEGWNIQQAMENGSQDVPRSVRRKRNRALADAARGDFRGRLVLAAPRAGSTVQVLDAHVPTGRTCSRCGSVKTKPVPPAESVFTCPECGYSGDRRLNTARVLAGMASQAGPSGPQTRGEDVRPEAPRRGGRSSVKRAARTRPPGRGETGTSDP